MHAGTSVSLAKERQTLAAARASCQAMGESCAPARKRALCWSLNEASAGQREGRAMSLILFLILLVVSGLVVGALARLLLLGPDPMGIGATILLGLAGSFIAGLFSWFVLHRHGAGLLLSVLFSMLVLWLRRRSLERRGL